MDYRQWVTTTPHPTYCDYWAININWNAPVETTVYLGPQFDDEDADVEAFRQTRNDNWDDPTYDLHSEPACWQEAIDNGGADEDEAREAYEEYLKEALKPDAPGMDKWMADKQAEHFGTDAGVGNPPEGNS